MNSVAERVGRIRARVEVRWSDERAATVENGLRVRRRRRAIGRALSIAATIAVAIAGSAGLAWRRHNPSTGGDAAIARRIADPRALTFADGSTALLLDGGSRIATRIDSPREVRVDLEAGGARFSVVHDPTRRFRIAAGALSVEVLGTEFTVERAPDFVRVAVERGAVRVAGGGDATILRAGEERRFPSSAPISSAPGSAAEWKLLALEGDFDRAWPAMRGAPPVDDAGDLLLAADVARLSRHPAEAIAPLRRVQAAHRDDPRAALAAFTLGRVLLEDLGQPREAAAAFADALTLAPDGALAADALAREAEAWWRASDARRARDCAADYSRRYPHGARLRAVRRYGGME